MNKELKKQIANKGYTDEDVAKMIAMYEDSKQAEEQPAQQTEEVDPHDGDNANTPEVVEETVSTQETQNSDNETITVKKSEIEKMVKSMVASSLKGTPNQKPKPNVAKSLPTNGIDPWGEI